MVVLATSIFIGSVLFLLSICFSRTLAYLFTTSDDVVDAVIDLTPLLAMLNSVQPVLSGYYLHSFEFKYRLGLTFLKIVTSQLLYFNNNKHQDRAAVGDGLQSSVAYVNIACYYLVGVPLGVILGYLIGYEVKVK